LKLNAETWCGFDEFLFAESTSRILTVSRVPRDYCVQLLGVSITIIVNPNIDSSGHFSRCPDNNKYIYVSKLGGRAESFGDDHGECYSFQLWQERSIFRCGIFKVISEIESTVRGSIVLICSAINTKQFPAIYLHAQTTP